MASRVHTLDRDRRAQRLNPPDRSPGGPAIVARMLEQERNHTNAWLHDRTLQVLEYLASDGLGAGLDGDDLRRIAGLAADELRLFVEAPHTAGGDDLVALLRQSVVDTQLLCGALTVRLVVNAMDRLVAAPVVLALASAAREALTNARKHARADEVVVTCAADSSGITVSIRDDGIGFDPEAAGARSGISRSIIGRMLESGGAARIESAPGEGTCVTLHVAPRRETRRVR